MLRDHVDQQGLHWEYVGRARLVEGPLVRAGFVRTGAAAGGTMSMQQAIMTMPARTVAAAIRPRGYANGHEYRLSMDDTVAMVTSAVKTQLEANARAASELAEPPAQLAPSGAPVPLAEAEDDRINMNQFAMEDPYKRIGILFDKRQSNGDPLNMCTVEKSHNNETGVTAAHCIFNVLQGGYQKHFIQFGAGARVGSLNPGPVCEFECNSLWVPQCFQGGTFIDPDTCDYGSIGFRGRLGAWCSPECWDRDSSQGVAFESYKMKTVPIPTLGGIFLNCYIAGYPNPAPFNYPVPSLFYTDTRPGNANCQFFHSDPYVYAKNTSTSGAMSGSPIVVLDNKGSRWQWGVFKGQAAPGTPRTARGIAFYSGVTEFIRNTGGF